MKLDACPAPSRNPRNRKAESESFGAQPATLFDGDMSVTRLAIVSVAGEICWLSVYGLPVVQLCRRDPDRISGCGRSGGAAHDLISAEKYHRAHEIHAAGAGDIAPVAVGLRQDLCAVVVHEPD